MLTVRARFWGSAALKPHLVQVQVLVQESHHYQFTNSYYTVLLQSLHPVYLIERPSLGSLFPGVLTMG